MPSRQAALLKRLALLLVCCTGVPSDLRADPLLFHGTYFLVDASPERLDLFSNPGAVLEPRTYGGTIFPPAFSFAAFVRHAGGESITDTIRFVYQEAGTMPQVFTQTFTTGTSPVELGFATLFEPRRRTGTPIPTTLTVDLLNSAPDFLIPGGPNQGQLVDSFTYSFATQTPIPEPSTLLLLVSGGVAAAAGRRRRHKGKSKEA